jgi:Phage-related tail fibre protein
MLQKQIERFGDHVFKRGTVVDGCEITYDDAMQYVKVKDTQVDGAPVNLAQFTGYYVKDTASVTPLVASIETFVDGFETQTPNLKTLYVNYINSGNDGSERQQFVANDTLTVYRPDFPVENIQIANASAGFSNSDSVVILSALAVQNSTGGTTLANNFFVGDGVTDGTANVQIVEVNTTANSAAIILKVKPLPAGLNAANSDTWTFSTNTTVQSTNAAPSDVVKVVGFVGTGAAALMRTGTINGEVSTVTVTQKGSGYYVAPTVSIQSTGATTGQINSAILTAQTNLTTITVANGTVDPVGTGYSVIVSDGVIYQKGYFSRVNSHRVVVEKYSNTGFDKVVGFDTTETIVDSNQDTSLLDNATGEPNVTAPGANRLKLTPNLIVKTKAQADANTDFLPIVEFSGGNPYKFTARTVYNKIGEQLAKRTFEESGNYVIDPFILKQSMHLLLQRKHQHSISRLIQALPTLTVSV